MRLEWLLVIACSAAAACTSPVELGDHGDAGGGSSGSSGSGSGSGSGGSGGSSGSSSGSTGSSSGSGGGSGSSSGGTTTTDLSGTWDLLATSPSGGTTSGTLTLATDTFVLDIPSTGSQLSYTASGANLSVVWTLDGSSSAIRTMRTAATMNTGIIPVDVGGSWTFSSPNGGEQCVANLSPAAALGSCNTYIYPWPNPLPMPLPGVQYTAMRTQQFASVFGDLGGTWQATDGQGGPGACIATFQGSTFSASCNDATDAFAGSVQLTFNGTDNMASGTTGDGVELSAQKQ